VNESTEFKWPEYPPITQTDDRSKLYWRLVKAQEFAVAMMKAAVADKPESVQRRADPEQEPEPDQPTERACLQCGASISANAKHNKLYCSPACRNERRLKERLEMVVAARAAA
jgi:hypothetical protein